MLPDYGEKTFGVRQYTTAMPDLNTKALIMKALVPCMYLEKYQFLISWKFQTIYFTFN